MSQPIRVSILGSGMSLAVFHRPSILFHTDKYTLHSVLERSGRGKVKEICGNGVKVVKSLEEVVSDTEVDLVGSNSAAALSYTTLTVLGGGEHTEQYAFPICQNCHRGRQTWLVQYTEQPSEGLTSLVLIEKPMCVTSAQATELCQLAESKNVILSVYQNRRWDSDFLTVQEILKSGKVREAPGTLTE